MALLAAVLILGFAVSGSRQHQIADAALEQAIEAEQANFERALLEQNSDRIVEKTLETELQKGELDPTKINEAIARNLMNFFEKTELELEGIRFYWVETTPESYNRILELEPHELDEGKIEEITKTIVVKKGPLVVGETVFTGGTNQNQAIVARIENPEWKDFFLVPIGYSICVEVIA